MRVSILAVKHAGPNALDALEPLLGRLRTLSELKERKRGSFYHAGSGFLHFHEDPAGIFADVKIDGVFERTRVSTRAERSALLARVRAVLAARAEGRKTRRASK